MNRKHLAAACVLFVFSLGSLPAAFGEEKPVALYKGLGSWTHRIATTNPEAQKYFDQGLSLNYGFNRYEALRSFRKAAELDPNALMAYWGMAWAQGPYLNMDGDPTVDLKGACAAVEAGRKVTGAPPREQAYLAAAALWCPEYRPKLYSDAMRALAAAYPDDPDAATLYAESLLVPARWHWYDAKGVPAPGVAEADRALEGVLRRWPQHPGANHYYIHSAESSPSPERAIASAQRLMGIVPAAGHMVHMPGHIWLVLGEWQTAVDVNERAVAVDREYFAQTGVTDGPYTPYYVHNLNFILFARSMQGRRAETVRAAQEMGAAIAPMARMMPEMADSFASVLAPSYARVGAWEEILKSPEPDEKMTASRLTWRYARTLALLSRGDRGGAARERDAFEKLRQGIPATAPWGMNTAAGVSATAAEVLAARLSTEPGEALAHWRSAVENQDRLSYDEPPDWYYPVRESLGAALLLSGKPAEAEIVFREGVNRTPHNGRMLFGLLQSLKAQNKQNDAEWVESEFQSAWAGSDITLRMEDL